MGNGVEMGEIGMLWCVGPSYGVRPVLWGAWGCAVHGEGSERPLALITAPFNS